METYTNTYSVSNTASSSYSNSSNYNSPTQFSSREERNRKPPYHAALHSVRKLPAKHVIAKKPIAPMPPTPPKIYKVESVNFRDVVQSLTAAPEFQRTRVAQPFDGGSAAAWCSSLLLTPGTISSFDKTALHFN